MTTSSTTTPHPSGRRKLAGLLVSTLTLLALGGGSLASVAQAAGTACTAATTSEPFLKWGDESAYWLAPGGGFEKGEAAWTLSGSSKQVAGSDPFAISGKLGASSLSIPSGSSGQSPFMCVEASERTFRFIARSEGASATVRIDLVYETATGTKTVAGKPVTLTSTWGPSPAMRTGALIATAIKGESAHLALRFVTTAGTAVIDDVYIDPRMSK